MKKLFYFLILFFISSNLFSQNQRITDRLERKINSLNPLEYTRILIILNDRVDIETLDKELYRINAPLDYRALTVINTLKQKAVNTQGPVLDFLNSEKERGKVKELMNFWINNVIYAEATSDVILNLAKRSDIEMIDLDEKVFYDKPVYDDYAPANNHTESAETGLKVIKADLLWRLGITGAGRTVMHIDTGVDGLHPALAPRWWGNNGRLWSHSWFDPVSPFTTSPTDCGTHGTHTMGIMCGKNSASGDTVGVAPDAYWMSAGITDCPGASYPSMNIAAYQWAMDPDSNSATMDMPDVISCSWQDPNVSGTGQCTSIYVATLNAVEAAGIAVVFSAGNSGSGASTITPPKNINTDSVNVFSVGAVDGNTAGTPIASFSSRGPSICGGSGTLLIKPEVSAPGVNVRSLVPGNSYGTNSGTSMASPHVAGCIALLKQAAPGLTGKQLKAILFSTCTDLGTPGEDNNYGKGLVNVFAAYQQLGVFPLSSFNLQSPSAGTRLVTLPNSSTPVTITWDTSATGAQYKWVFGNPTTTPRKLTIPAFTNSISMTLGQLDNLLAGIGVAQGDSLVGQWDVWAYRLNPVDSMKATNGPRAITLKRGKPALTSFNLSSPPNNTTVLTLSTNTSPVNINWSKSGEAVKYKWMYARPNFSTSSNIKFIVQSGNNGYDSVLTLRNSQVDSLVAGLGVAQGDSAVGQWRVYGYSVTDSLASTQTNNITFRRGIPPTITTTLDSIVVNLPVNQTTSRNFNIGNTGQFALNWVITESSSAGDNVYVNNSKEIERLNALIENQPKGSADIYHGEEVTDNQGGPDVYGYRWIDSDEPGGPVFNWVDISTTGTLITTWTSGTGDDGSVIVPLPFAFNYYGADYNQLKICTNGWQSFNVVSTSNAYLNSAIPATADPNLTLYPFWDDQDVRTAGGIYYYNDAANNRFIVMYKDVPHYTTGELYTYETIIYSDGRIYYQYLNMTSTLVNSCTIGTENATGTDGLQVVFNSAYLHNNLAIKIEKGLAWVDENPSSGTVVPAGNQQVAVNFNSAGLTPNSSYTGNLNVGSNDPARPVKTIKVRLNVGPLAIQSNSTLTGIPATFELKQNYPNPFNPSTKISYALPKEGIVSLKIYDVLGKEVATLVNENKLAGYYEVEFNASSFASGLYFYKIEAGNFAETRRMLLIK